MKWEMVKLGSIVKNLDNKRVPLNRSERKEKEREGKYPYFGANNIVGWIDEYIFDGKILCIAEDGGSWGKSETCAFVYEGKCWVNNHAHVLKENGRSDINYLKYYINYSDLNKFITGTTRGKLTKTALNKIQIPLPPLPIQRQIAELLDTATVLRQKTEAQLAELDRLAESVFLEMFGDPVRNEKGWKTIQLGDVSEIVSGVTKGRKLQGKKLVEVPYMRVANVQDGRIDLNEIKTIKVLATDVEKYRLKDQDVLLTEGGDPDKLGRGAVWRYEIEDCIHQNHIFRVRPDFSKLNSDYLSAQIGSMYGKRYFLKVGKQTTGIATINSKQLKKFPTQIPPLPLQTHFAQIIENIEAQKAVLRRSLQESEDLVGCLLQEVFS